MRFSQINLLILIYSVKICFFLENEEFNYNNFQNLKNSKKFKRNVEILNNQENLYNKNVLSSRQTKKSLTYYENYRKKRMVSSDPKAKWNFPIPYYVNYRVNHTLVDSALSMISKETCIRFRKYKIMKYGIAGINYFYGDDCSSPVGQQGKRIWQSISIGKGCDSIGKIQHETLHALGFYHEHSRYDRNRYIYFLKQNIDEKYYRNFDKVLFENSNTFDIPFDFGSVMMYGMDMLSKNGKDTMISYDFRYRHTYGIADQVSFGDVKMLNYYYCSKKCPKKLKCMNGGYQDPNNCKKCKCVRGFIGSFCNMYSLPTKECGPSRLYATSKLKEFGTIGKKNCIYHILCEKDKKIALKIINSHFFPNELRICHVRNSLEVKYWSNKISTGARFCLHKSNIMIFSYNNHVLIYFKSNDIRNYFHIAFKSLPKSYEYIKVEREFSIYNNLAE